MSARSSSVARRAAKLRHRRLDRAANLEELPDERLALVECRRVAGEADLGHAFGDDRPIAAPFEVARRSEPLDRFAHRRSGDTELLAQLPFGRYRAARLQLAGADCLEQLGANLRRDRAPLHRRERRVHRTPCIVCGTWSGCQTIFHGRSATAPRRLTQRRDTSTIQVMADWNPEQYRRFAGERARPFHDLLGLIEPAPIERAVDLGCGPGELTRSPPSSSASAEMVGIDNSQAMLDKTAEHVRTACGSGSATSPNGRRLAMSIWCSPRPACSGFRTMRP